MNWSDFQIFKGDFPVGGRELQCRWKDSKKNVILKKRFEGIGDKKRYCRKPSIPFSPFTIRRTSIEGANPPMTIPLSRSGRISPVISTVRDMRLPREMIDRSRMGNRRPRIIGGGTETEAFYSGAERFGSIRICWGGGGGRFEDAFL